MKGAKSQTFQLADLKVDAGQRRVWRSRREIELPKRSFDLLVALIDAAPNSLSTDELIDQVWDGVIVSPTTVAKRVELLRHALDDNSDAPKYVALVRGHGYRLVPEVAEPDAESTFRVRTRFFATVVAIIAAIAIGWTTFQSEPLPEEKSVAVLPFSVFSDEKDDERFADGLTEELIHALTRTGELRVTGRTSSFYYKGRRGSVREIGAALNVAHLLEGSVRRDGNRIRVTAQLVDTNDGFQLWSEAYDRPFTDVLQIQQDIARSVSGRLQSSMAPARVVGRTRTSSNPEAYALYLKAVSLSPYPFGIDPPAAQELLETVVDMDPGFAAAWALLAAVHGRRLVARDPTYSMAAGDALEFIYNALNKARALDPQLADTYATLGGMAWAVENDPHKAAPLIEKALDLDPYNLNFIAFAANFATYIGRPEEALALEELLIERDPLCVTCRYQLAQSYQYTKRFGEMERELQTLQAMGRTNLEWQLAIAKLYLSQPREALQYVSQLDENSTLQQLGRAMALHDLGDRQQAAELLADAASRWGDRSPLVIAQAYAYTGDADSAFEQLQAAVDIDARSIYFQFPSPLFDSLRQDPRWHELLALFGLSPEQLATVPFTLRTGLQQEADALNRTL